MGVREGHKKIADARRFIYEDGHDEENSYEKIYIISTIYIVKKASVR